MKKLSIVLLLLLQPFAPSAAEYPLTFSDSTGKEIVGGFLKPDMERVASLKPDVLFYSSLHEKKIERFRGKATLVNLSTSAIEDADKHLRFLGDIFDKEMKQRT